MSTFRVFRFISYLTCPLLGSLAIKEDQKSWGLPSSKPAIRDFRACSLSTRWALDSSLLIRLWQRPVVFPLRLPVFSAPNNMVNIQHSRISHGAIFLSIPASAISRPSDITTNVLPLSIDAQYLVALFLASWSSKGPVPRPSK